MARRYIFLCASLLIIATLIGCDIRSAKVADAIKIKTVTDQNFITQLNAILASNPGQYLLFIHFWNDWQAVTLDKNTEDCVAWKWDGKIFTKTEMSSGLCREPRYPLSNLFMLARVDYYQATDLAQNLLEDINNASISNFNEQLTTIKINDEIRPIWILPFAKDAAYPVGVLADDGKIINSVKLENSSDSSIWSKFWNPKHEWREVHEAGWYDLLEHVVVDQLFLFILMGFLGVSLIVTALSLGRGEFIGAACIQIGLVTAGEGASIDATGAAITIVFFVLFFIFFFISVVFLSIIRH